MHDEIKAAVRGIIHDAAKPTVVYVTKEVFRPPQRTRRVYGLTIAVCSMLAFIPPTYSSSTSARPAPVASTSCPPSKVILGQCNTADYVIDHLIGGNPVRASSADDPADPRRIRQLVL